MAHIKTEATLILTRDEAIRYLKNLNGRVHFALSLNKNLPIPSDPGKAFPGYAHLPISKAQMIKAIEGLLNPVLEGRGGRIELRVSPPMADYPGSAAYVTL